MAAHDPSIGFGELLRDYRRAAGLTQEELAERAGVSPRSISGLERGGAHIPRRDTVVLLVHALGLAGADRDRLEALVKRRRGFNPVPISEQPLRVADPVEPPSRHNVPRSLTSFVGRIDELDELAAALRAAPLLTLVGAGGVGKTRLALELARQQLARFADGAWLVELAALADPSLVPGAIATAIGLRDLNARNIVRTLTDYLRERELLLVLDNCEHLLPACAELVSDVLRACPRLQVLVTSREPLGSPGEVIWRVPPLELPDLQRAQSPEQITRSPAVQLFVERARALNNTLLLTEYNARAIARVCIALDGIPLALELAAARARVLTPEQLAERLERGADVLRGSDRGALPRHQTMRSTIDWSYDLLGEREQMLLRRLSVFAGGWTLDRAEEVCIGGAIARTDVLDVLAQHVDKSMVLVDARHSAARYRFLEPIRQYAQERLEASDEAGPYRSRHAAAYLTLAHIGEGDPSGPDEIPSLERLELEHDNLRATLQWTLANRERDAALRASAALFHFWERRGHFQEGCAWLEQALASAGDEPSRYRGRALNALASLYWRGGDAERALPIAEQALAINRAGGDSAQIAWALLNLGMIAYLRHQHDLAVARLEESVPAARMSKHLPLLSVALTFLGRTLLWVKGSDDRRAAQVLEEALSVAQLAQSHFASGHALATLGDLRWGQGKADRAVQLWRQALTVGAELSDRRGIAGCIERLALALTANSELESAAWLFGAADAQHKQLGLELRGGEAVDHRHFVSVTQQQLGDMFADAWSAGQSASVEDAIAGALQATGSLQTQVPTRHTA